jgi:hypothetical protein
MKKKIFIGIAMSLFAVATVFNMNISEQSKAGDISLDDIKIMTQAEAENSGFLCAHVSYSWCVWEDYEAKGSWAY